jgi:hypothetical protein
MTARFTYTSTEDGQVIESDERLDHLDGLARWIVEDAETEAPEAPVFTGDSMIQLPSPIPVAGPVNLDPITGGNPPLVSAGAGFSAPSEIISQEEAARRQAEALEAGAPKPEGDGGTPEAETEIPDGEPTDKWSAAAVKAFANRERIDLGDAKNKGEYLEVIEKAGIAPAGDPAADWTILQLKAYARREEIDLDGAELHDDVFEKVATPKQ